MEKLEMLFFVQLYQVFFIWYLHANCFQVYGTEKKDTCVGKETPSLCVERSQSIRITSTVNGTGSGTLVVCGKNVREHLTIMAGNDEIFPLSTGRYVVTVSESGYHSTVNITVHNLTERDQGVIPLVLLKCRKIRVYSQILIYFKSSTDQLKFTYQLIKDDHESSLKLHCEAMGYPRVIQIKDITTKALVASKKFNSKNYWPTMLLEALFEPSCLLIQSYICEVTDFQGKESTRTLHVTHPECSSRRFDVITNESRLETKENITDKDKQVTKYNSQYQDIFLHNQTNYKNKYIPYIPSTTGYSSSDSVNSSGTEVTIHVIVAVVILFIFIIVVTVVIIKGKLLYKCTAPLFVVYYKSPRIDIIRNNNSSSPAIETQTESIAIARASFSRLDNKNIYTNCQLDLSNANGLNYVTVDHSIPGHNSSTNVSSQNQVVYARLDFQKMARQHTE